MRKIVLSAMCLTLLSAVASGQTSPTANQFGPEVSKANPEAWSFLEKTRHTRYYFVENFTGCAVDVELNDNGKITTGVFSYGVKEGADLQVNPGYKEAEPWALETILNMIQHRRSPDFARGDGRHPITFSEDDNSPAGRRVLLNDPMRSSYRIRDGRVTEVARTAGDTSFVITIIEETPAGQEKYLPKHFTVTYFDAKTGGVKRTETFTDEYKMIDGVWFPASRRIFRAEDGKVITRVIKFQNPRIQFKERSSQ